MPQLPSGRHVALSSDTSLALARQGNFTFCMLFTTSVNTPEDLGPLIEIAYFKPDAGKPRPGIPYRSGMLLEDVGTPKCDWSDIDVEAFRVWLGSEFARGWLQSALDEIKSVVQSAKIELPDNLKGIMEGD